MASKKPKKVAIFDIDGTIFRSSLVIELLEELIDRGLFPLSAREVYRGLREKWLDRKGDYESYVEAVVIAYMHHIKGLFYGDLVEAAEHVILKQKNRVYRYTRDLLKELKKDGYYLLAISQSPKTILDLFCKEMGFDKTCDRIVTGKQIGRAHV